MRKHITLVNRKTPKTKQTDLLFSLSFLDVVSPHFDPGSQDGSGKLHYIHPQQMAELLSSWRAKQLHLHQKKISPTVDFNLHAPIVHDIKQKAEIT